MTEATPPGDWPLPGDLNLNIGTRHHLVPRFYLERFAQDGQVSVVDRNTGARRLSQIKDTAAEKDFYTFVNTQGQMDGRVEQLLGEVEGRGAQVIRKLTSAYFGEPSIEDRTDFCTLVAFQIMRGRTARRRSELMADMWARLQISFINNESSARSALNSQGITDPTNTEVQELIEASGDIDNLEFVPDPNEHISHIGPNALKVLPYLASRSWLLVEFAAPSVLTSDEPVALYSPGEHNEHESLGIENADQIIFPLDPKRLMVLVHEQHELGSFTRIKGTHEWARLSNWLMAHNAYSHIFLHPGHDVQVPTVPESGPLFRVSEDASSVLSRYNQPPAHRGTQRRRRNEIP